MSNPNQLALAGQLGDIAMESISQLVADSSEPNDSIDSEIIPPIYWTRPMVYCYYYYYCFIYVCVYLTC